MVVRRTRQVLTRGEICDTAYLSDGRVLRVVGHYDRCNPSQELDKWIDWTFGARAYLQVKTENIDT